MLQETVIALFVTLLALSVANVEEVASCTDPSGRKEWRTLRMSCLSGLSHSSVLTPSVHPDDIAPVNTSSSYYDGHLHVFIHFTGLFLPFHPWYVQVHEYALKEKCGFKGSSPYWNWAEDASNFFNSKMFQEFDPISGLGRWGNLSDDAQVPDGAFSDFKLSYPYHTLRRNFTLQPYIGQDPTLFTEPYLDANTSFTYDLGGTCPIIAPSDCIPGPTFSANEPLFWMHHAVCIFYGGSVQMIENGTIYNEYPNGGPPLLSLESIIPADEMFQESSIGDVVDTTAGLLCYVYE
ncbi:Di-copper centre-containing protein [Lentinula aciculospora]|uniref:Di-copper centre-containing protein n=1 Tax=Lentinula aciculospora TaxID=153920 RepID=A0A9W9A7X0_9AGAR|nr:Di-copper centre-containing protein [Lentinula aciculospora]